MRIVKWILPVLFVVLVYLIYLPLSVLIPSSSGLATLSIPIVAPLGRFAGVGGDLVVTAFQSASGEDLKAAAAQGIVQHTAVLPGFHRSDHLPQKFLPLTAAANDIDA